MEQEELDKELMGVGNDPVPDLDLPTPGTSLPGMISVQKRLNLTHNPSRSRQEASRGRRVGRAGRLGLVDMT